MKGQRTQRVPFRDLVAVSLKYSPGAEPYRDAAYAQLCSKAMYAAGNEPQYPRRIASDIAGVLGVRSIPLPAVEKALGHLHSRGATLVEDGRWCMTATGLSQVQSDVTRSTNRALSVLKRHFPPRIPSDKLMDWLHDVYADFFEAYADRWVAAKYKDATPRSALPSSLDAVLRPCAERRRLDKEMPALVAGFEALLSSTNPEDVEELHCAAMAMFASRLVAANISADPLTLSLVRGSVLLLDTNVLIAAQLERHHLADSLAALGSTLDALGVQLLYAPRTRREYVGALATARDQTIRAVSTFSQAVVSRARDAWVKTAQARLCKVVSDYERFFDDLGQPPQRLGTSAVVEELDTPEVATATGAGEADEVLKRDIQAFWLKLRRRRKRTEPTKHDAALIRVGRHLRDTDKNCYILTLDLPLCEYGRDSAGPYEMPLTVSLDSLLQILAVDYAGASAPPAAFAPLMARMLIMQFEPSTDSYTLEDLAWLADIEERAAGLPDEKVEALATSLCRARLSGKSADDPDVRLAIQRAFQASRIMYAKELGEAQAAAKTKDTEARQWRSDYDEVRGKAVGERTKRLRGRAIGNAVVEAAVWLVVAVAVAVTLVRLAYSVFGQAGRPILWWNLLTVVTPVLAAIVRILFGVFPKLRRTLAESRSKASAELDGELPRPHV